MKKTIYSVFIKRFLDIMISTIILVIFSWLYIILAILVRVKLGSPVLFKQHRPGKDEKIFKVIKFKTMTDERDAEGKLLPDTQRLTEVGKIVRSLSIDELPQLVNVFKGDMSLIGPRPLLVKYLPLYDEEQKRRHEVRPGLTGWAQVHGRNNITWKEKFELDLWYVDHCTLWTDIKVIFMTIKNVFSGKDVSVMSGSFDGTN